MEGDRVKSQSLRGPRRPRAEQTLVWAEPPQAPGSSAPPTKIAWSPGIPNFFFFERNQKCGFLLNSKFLNIISIKKKTMSDNVSGVCIWTQVGELWPSVIRKLKCGCPPWSFLWFS